MPKFIVKVKRGDEVRQVELDATDRKDAVAQAAVHEELVFMFLPDPPVKLCGNRTTHRTVIVTEIS